MISHLFIKKHITFLICTKTSWVIIKSMTTEKPEPKIRKEKNTELSITNESKIEGQMPEIQVDAPLMPAIKNDSGPKAQGTVDDQIQEQMTPENQKLLKELLEQVRKEHKESFEPIKFEPLVMESYGKEIMVTDVVCKTFVANMEELGQNLGKDIEKSATLAVEWKEQIKATDTYIKSLKGLPWKRLMTWSSCLLLLGGFLWKMGMMRALPDFAGSFLNVIPKLTPSNISSVKEIPKPSATNIVETLAHTPLTPIGIVAGVGVITVSLGILKGLVWVFRKVK